MGSRIEIAEVFSFRLSVERSVLDTLVSQLASELSLVLVPQADALLLKESAGDSYLRFREEQGVASLTEIAICNDENGAFYGQVVHPLMKQGAGDLHLRLVWNEAQRNTQGHFAEVRLIRGQPVRQLAATRALKNTLAAPATGLEGGAVADPSVAGRAEEPPGATTSAEEDEIARLLAAAREHWEEYHRLKRGG